MSLAHVVLGRREPKRARSLLVCGIAAARLTFEVELELSARAAGIAFHPPETPGFAGVEDRFDELLASIGEDTGARTGHRDDGFGLRWMTLRGGSLDDQAISLGVAAESLDLAGCWELLVCAVFAFERKRGDRDARVYWIYNFARGSFYAFVPRDDDRRHSELEHRLEAAVAHDLPLERDPQRRYPLWGMPL